MDSTTYHTNTTLEGKCRLSGLLLGRSFSSLGISGALGVLLLRLNLLLSTGHLYLRICVCVCGCAW